MEDCWAEVALPSCLRRYAGPSWYLCFIGYLLTYFVGHGGSATAEHTVAKLPKRIRHALLDLIRAHDGLDRDNVAKASDSVIEMLEAETRTFDKSIGAAVKKLCPNPADLTETQARALVDEHLDVLQRAWCGTTLAAALINVTHRFMWATSVGDSTVGKLLVPLSPSS